MKAIPGFPGYYADTDGNILSDRLGAARILHNVIHRGYPHVFVRTGRGNDTVRKLPVHSLVLLTYAGRREPWQVCRHLKGDPCDNRLVNLRWGSHQENAMDAIRHGTAACIRTGEDHPASKLKRAEVLAIRQYVEKGMRRSDAASLFGITARHVGNLINGASWPHICTTAHDG